MSLNDEMRKDIFRKAASTAIENSHNAIKQVWVVLFAGGTFALIQSFDLLLSCAITIDVPGDRCRDLATVRWNRPNFWLHFLFYVIYVLTFYRFYVGNIRVFDMRYVEVVKFVAAIDDKLASSANSDPTKTKEINQERDDLYRTFFKNLDEHSRFRDSIFLMAKTIVIITLTIQVNRPLSFIVTYIIILLLDIIWMTWADYKHFVNHLRHGLKAAFNALFEQKIYFRDLFFERLDIRAGQNECTNRMFPSGALKFWAKNNFSCLVVLLILFAMMMVVPHLEYVTDQKLALWILYALSGIVMMINCWCDLSKTWNFYNPTFTKLHEHLPLEAPKS